MQNNSFRTEIQENKAEFSISHKDFIMLMGSCFAENIGEKLTEHKFQTDVNPFGILFNPMSIAQSLDILTSSFLFKETDLQLFNNEWISFYHHGKFSHPDPKICLETINKKLTESRIFLQKADFLILTLGSTVSYSYKGNIVANCHKIPQKEFQKQMLTNQDIVSALMNSIEKIRAINKDIQLIFTVSPVRYIKNSMTENTFSKAHLIVAIHKLINRLRNSYYFPAFEIMMDDLRDYRFYNEDMIHPSPPAIDYIWENFSYTFFDEQTSNLNEKIKDIYLATNHRMKTPYSEESKQFRAAQIKKIEQLHILFPHIAFDKELAYFKQS